ncbi:hypothetical protein [Nocardioides speluncae]|uniref:hypothetical protein n=1 Tax=Nocardioides speluncae TaxID=2670337 RepID=UPI000D69BA25|nr:hypothetical protein [Nocardioides speluncae]
MRHLGTLLTVVAGAALVGCGGTTNAERPSGPTEPAPTTIPPVVRAGGPARVLALVPESATTLTITDFDAVRARLGVPDLTSEDLMADRTAFWERAGKESVLLTDGLLREDSSAFMLDHGFTQDDVDWEARWTGPDGPGYALAFRPDLDLSGVQAAVKAGTGPLDETARVLAADHLLVSGEATDGGPVWATDPAITDLVVTGEESAYLRRGCLPLQEALGVDATYEDHEAVLAEYDVTELEPLEAVALTFKDQVVTARLGEGRTDLRERADLGPDWPVTGSIGFEDGFTGMPVIDPNTGRIGYRVANPVAAANLTLTHLLPFAICDEVEPFEEPTGL